MTDLSKLPVLPEGWHYEEAPKPKSNAVYVIWEGHGAYTVCFDSRSFSPGFCAPRWTSQTPSYVGRDWRQKLVLAAIADLKGIFA